MRRFNMGVSTNSRKHRKRNKRSNFDLEIPHRFQLKKCFFTQICFVSARGYGTVRGTLPQIYLICVGKILFFQKTQLRPANLFDLREFEETPNLSDPNRWSKIHLSCKLSNTFIFNYIVFVNERLTLTNCSLVNSRLLSP